MAAAMSAWSKPGAWALDAEEHDEALAVGKDLDASSLASEPQQQQHDFPSLAAAAASKTSKKKKKPQPVSLAEFTSGKQVSYGSGGRGLSSSGITPDQLLALPTGPRERSAEELERSSSRGFGYSYGSRGRMNGEEDNPNRWGASRVSDEPRRGGFGGSNRDLEPSRADEIDDWGAAKKSTAPERRERVGGGRGLFESHSRADESDSWISTKSSAPPRAGSGGGFVGSRDRMGGFDMLNKEGSNGGRADSDTWGRKKDLTVADAWKNEEDINNGGRRRLVLQPRSMPLSNGDNVKPVQGEKNMVSPEKKSRASNPFGAARPREEVLAEKGQDWKEIEEKLESMKIRDAQRESVFVSKKGFGTSNGSTDSENSWRKPLTTESFPRNDKAENIVPEN